VKTLIRQRKNQNPLKVHQPCTNPDCGSSDAMSVYEDHTFCFSCKKYNNISLDNHKKVWEDILRNDLKDNLKDTFLKDTTNKLIDYSYNLKDNLKDNLRNNLKVIDYKLETRPWRGITENSMRKYGVCHRLLNDQPFSIVFPYGEDARKVRLIDRKEFFAEGSMNGGKLFGMDRFGPATAKAITLCEGETDTLSAYQMLGSKYPVVGVRSAPLAKGDCEANFKYLNSFETIYICFDNDTPGHEASRQVAELFDVTKVRVVNIGGEYKDCNDYLTAGKADEFNKIWWNAKQYLPEGVLSSYAEIEKILDGEVNTAIANYPFSTLNDMSFGIRPKEVVLFTAQEGIGKTEIIRATEYSVLKETDLKIGIIHLEEGDRRSVQGLVSYELDVPCHLPDSNVSTTDQLKAFKALTKQDGRVYFYSHYGSDDSSSILDIIRYLVVTCGCKIIFLDHITMLVTGDDSGDDERRKLDYISTRLAMMVHQHNFALLMISHINDDGKTRGSRNISKIANLWVQLDRDKVADTYEQRNTTKLTVIKNRFSGKTGDAGYLIFDPMTFKLREKSLENDGTINQPLSPF